jgi:uncharacterized circularly permuted ATP-grasp superfamily protein
MHKFDEMVSQLPEAGGAQSPGGGPFQFQARAARAQVQVQSIRDHYRNYALWLARQSGDGMRARREEAEMIFRRVGITFAVYGAKDEEGAGTERLIPFDLIPRIIPADEWATMEKGLVQRVTALNRFLHDVYHEQDIIKAGIIPAEQILNNVQFRKENGGRVRAAPRLLAHRGRGHRARVQRERRGRVLRARRQPAGAQRRELHAGRPQDDDAAVPRSFQRASGGARHALPRPAAGNPAGPPPSPARPTRRWWC